MGRDGLFPDNPAASSTTTTHPTQEQQLQEKEQQQRAAAAAVFALGNAAIPCTVPHVKLSELDLPLGAFDSPVVIEVDGEEGGGEAR